IVGHLAARVARALSDLDMTARGGALDPLPVRIEHQVQALGAERGVLGGHDGAAGVMRRVLALEVTHPGRPDRDGGRLLRALSLGARGATLLRGFRPEDEVAQVARGLDPLARVEDLELARVELAAFAHESDAA